MYLGFEDEGPNAPKELFLCFDWSPDIEEIPLELCTCTSNFLHQLKPSFTHAAHSSPNLTHSQLTQLNKL